MAISITNYKNVNDSSSPHLEVKKIKSYRKNKKTIFEINYSIPAGNGGAEETIDIGIFSGDGGLIQKQLNNFEKINLSFLQNTTNIESKNLDEIVNFSKRLSAKYDSPTPFTKAFSSLKTTSLQAISGGPDNVKFSVDDSQNVIIVFFVKNPGVSSYKDCNVTVCIPSLRRQRAYQVFGTLENQIIMKRPPNTSERIPKIQFLDLFNETFKTINNIQVSSNLTDLQEQIRDRNSRKKLTVNISNNYQNFSELFVSENIDNSVSSLFFFNLKNVLRQLSALPRIIKDKGIEALILKDTKLSVEVTRTSIIDNFGTNKFGLRSNKNYKPLDTIKNYQITLKPGNILDTTSQINLDNMSLSDEGLRSYSFTDMDMANQNSGKFSYKTRIEFEDPTVQVLKNVYNLLETSKASLDHIGSFLKSLEMKGTTGSISNATLNAFLEKENELSIEKVYKYIFIYLKIIKALSAADKNGFIISNDNSRINILSYAPDLNAMLDSRVGLDSDMAFQLLQFVEKTNKEFEKILNSIGVGINKPNSKKSNSRNNTKNNTLIVIENEFKNQVVRSGDSNFGYSFLDMDKNNSRFSSISKTRVAHQGLKQLSKSIKIDPKNIKDSISKLKNYDGILPNVKLSDTALTYFTFEKFILAKNKKTIFVNDKNELNQHNLYENNTFNFRLLLSLLKDDFTVLTSEYRSGNYRVDLNQYKTLLFSLLREFNFDSIAAPSTAPTMKTISSRKISNVDNLTVLTNENTNFLNKKENGDIPLVKVKYDDRIYNLIIDYNSKYYHNNVTSFKNYLDEIVNFNLDSIKKINNKSFDSLSIPTHLKALMLGLNSFKVDERKESSEKDYAGDLDFFNKNFNLAFLNQESAEDPFSEPASWNTLNNNFFFVKKLVSLRGFRKSKELGVDLKTPIWSSYTLRDYNNKNNLFSRLIDSYGDYYPKRITHNFKTFNEYMVIR